MDYTPRSSDSMLISELAKKSSLPIDTIRFYEKKGLLDVGLIQRRNNNYREYTEDSLERLRLIQRAKRLGFTLIEIQEWIEDLESNQLTVDQKQGILGQKLEQIEERMNELKEMKCYLLEKLAGLHR
jgi:MerR family transcriptional regulator, copper efflux regulator